MSNKPITLNRIRRMRAEPRTVSLAGVRDQSEKIVRIDIIDDKIDEVIEFTPPKVVNSVQMRGESIVDKKPVGHTTVLKIKDAQEAVRVIPPSVRSTKQLHSLRGGVREKDSRRSKTVNTNPTAIREASYLNQMSQKINTDGLRVFSGQTLVVKLHQHDDRNLSLQYHGDQGMRIATWDDAGMPLLDVDVLPSEKKVITLPPKSEYLSLFGYGGDKSLFEGCIEGPGAISLNYSTDDTAGVGFHPRSRLVTSPIGYLCRGGLVNLSTISQSEKPWIDAVEALKHTKESIMKTSSKITTFAVVHSHDDIPSLECKGVSIRSDAYLIRGAALSISIWAVESGNESDTCTISASFSNSGTLHSMVGLVGHHEEWIEFFKSRDWTTIIEEGSITGKGESVVQVFSGEVGRKASAAPPPLKEIKVKPKTEQIVGPSFDLGTLSMGEDWSKDISNMAKDAEGDNMMFEKVSGPKGVNVTKEGLMTFKPDDSDLGYFKIRVQVADKGGNGGIATFFGTVVDSNARPYWIGGE